MVYSIHSSIYPTNYSSIPCNAYGCLRFRSLQYEILIENNNNINNNNHIAKYIRKKKRTMKSKKNQIQQHTMNNIKKN